MHIIRRAYIYLICAISLQAAAWALIGLAWQIIETYTAQTTAFLIAVVVVGLPIYLAHWLWAARLLRAGPDERESGIRSLFLYAMRAAFLAPFAATAFNLTGYWLAQLPGLGRAAGSADTPARIGTASLHELATLVVLGALWLYHTRRTRAEPPNDTGRVIPRLYLFGFSASGMLMVVWSAVGLLQILLGLGGSPYGERIWLADEIARLAVGLPLWLAGWQCAQALFARGLPGERDSILRKLYLYAVIGVAVAVTVTNATMILAGLIRSGFGLPSQGDLREPLTWIAVWAVVWAYHAVVLRADGRFGIGPRQAAVRRLYRYLIAAIAFAAFLGGVIGDISTLIRLLAGEPLVNTSKEQIAWFSAALVSGLCVWVYPWRQAQSSALLAGPAGADERRAAIRKLYLYLYIFAATVSVLGGAIYIVFRPLSIALGERFSGSLLADLGTALGFVAVAVVVWLYHGAALRGDGRQLAAEKSERLAGMRVVVIDAGRGAFGQAVLAGLRREFPALPLTPLGLTPEAAQAMGGSAASVEPIASATLIVGPWSIAVAGAAGGAVTPEIAAAVSASAARRLLAPMRAERWDWVGGEDGDDQAVARETVRAVRQVLDGEEVRGRSASPWPMLIGGLIAFWVLMQAFVMIMSLLTANRFD